MKRPTLLLYGLSGAGGEGWRRTAGRLNISVRDVRPAEYNLALSELLEGAPVKAPCALLRGLPEPMLVIAGFPHELMDVFLDMAVRAGASPVSLKAVLTETNARWTSWELYRQISSERDSIC